MNNYRVVVKNEQSGVNRVQYTTAASYGAAVHKVLDAVEDSTPMGSFPDVWTVTVRLATSTIAKKPAFDPVRISPH